MKTTKTTKPETFQSKAVKVLRKIYDVQSVTGLPDNDEVIAVKLVNGANTERFMKLFAELVEDNFKYGIFLVNNNTKTIIIYSAS